MIRDGGKMNKPTQVFRVYQDGDRIWLVQSLAGRIHARSPFKDTAIDLARFVARLRAPSDVHIHSKNGNPPKIMSYRNAR